jgi:hypothetical protein
MSSTKDDLSDLKQPETIVVHHLKFGQTDCPMSKDYGAPTTWPRGNSYSQRWQDVTCPGCLAAKPDDASA